MNNKQKINIFIRLNGAVLSVILVFFIVGCMTTYLSFTMSSDYIGTALEKNDLSSLYKYFFGFENHYYIQNDAEIKNIPLTKIGFQLATNIKINDMRTFFERELPGFSEFNTKIQVAGQGTDITSLPIESAPPIQTLLTERQVAKDALNHASDDQPNTPPAQTTDGKKVVYIYHSHSYESYLPLLQNVQSPNDATSNNNLVNVVGVGSQLLKDLEAKGIGAEQSTMNVAQKLHDKGWDTNNAYQLSRGVVQEAMASDHDLKFFIDIHRDSARRNKTTVTINNKSYARLDFIVGEGNPNFKQNLELAKQLHAAVEKKYPGLSRGVFSKDKSIGNGVYNQDLSPRAILIEVGGVDNNIEELDNAVEAFANVFSEYYWKLKNAGQF